MAYRLDLQEELARVHNVFHISMLRGYILDPSHGLEAPEIELRDDLSRRNSQCRFWVGKRRSFAIRQNP